MFLSAVLHDLGLTTMLPAHRSGDIPDLISNAFNEMLNHELDRKQPYPHWFHICTRVAHNRSPLTMADAPVALGGAPFDE
jgi:hypothetical protein